MMSKRIQQQVILDKYFAPKLSKKALRQLKTAVAKPQNQFVETLLFPQLIADSDGVAEPWLATPTHLDITPIHRLQALRVDVDDLSDRPCYMCMSASARVTARYQYATLGALESIADDTLMRFAEVQATQTYFTNHMRLWAGDDDNFHQPSLRSVLGPLTVLTLEFDPPDDLDEVKKLEAFEEQLRWLRRSGDTKASQPIQLIVEWAKGFSDFRGICVTYSGHKSLHFHFVFDTSALCVTHQDLRDQYRPAYAVAHDELSKAFVAHLPLEGLEPDRGMREPERFRRLPNGTRTVSSGKQHLFDVPAGTDVVQSVLFEELLRKAPKGANKRMFDPIKITQQVQSHKTPQAKQNYRPSVGKWHDDAEHNYWLEQVNVLLAKHADKDGFPKASHFEPWGDSILLKLFARKGDRNAGGVLFAHSNTPVFTGSGKQPTNRVTIGLPLNFYIEKWQKAWRHQNPNAPTVARLVSMATPVIQTRANVADTDITAVREMSKTELWDIAQDKKTVMFKGPTGFGKTFTTMNMLPDLVRDWRDRAMKTKEHAPSFERDQIAHYKSAVATATYEQAVEKCTQFNDIHSGIDAVGIVFRSFSQVYADALTEIYGDDAFDHMITADTASMTGQRSVTTAIKNSQPDVWQIMSETHAAMLKPFMDAPTGSVLVLFMVHDVLHQWTEGGLSHLMSHKDFFSTEPEQLWTLADQTKLVVAVQDEVTDAHLLHLERFQTVEWCERLFDDDPTVWGSEFIHLSEARRHWQSFHDNANDPTFETVLRVRRLGLSTKHEVGVGPIEPYCHESDDPAWQMYRATHASSFVYHKRSWWDGLAEHTFVLTTEHLPVMMFQSATAGQSNVAVYDLHNGPHPNGCIDVHTLGVLPSSANLELATSIREENPDAFVIANKVAELERTLTHASAKGVNHLDNDDIIQIINVVSPNEYSRMQVINLLYGLRSALKLRHIDQFNQTAGRNLGCRFKGHRHIAYMPTQLWKYLTSGSLTDFAFVMNLIETAEQRRDQRSNTDKEQLKRLERLIRDDDDLLLMPSSGPSDYMIDQYADAMGLSDLIEVEETATQNIDTLIDQQAEERVYDCVGS